MGYVLFDLGLAITHDMKTIYFFDQSLLPFGRIKIDLLLVGEAEEGNTKGYTERICELCSTVSSSQEPKTFSGAVSVLVQYG